MRSIKHPLAQGQLNGTPAGPISLDVMERTARQTDEDANDFEFGHFGMENL